MTGSVRLIMRGLIALGVAGAALLLGGCAAVPPDAGQHPGDPLERVNRQLFAMNDRFDRNVMAPVARGYEQAFPGPARRCLGNAFANLGEINNLVNASLQARPLEAAGDAGRFAVNATLGLLGCFDVATPMGLERKRQDFGLTFGRWGVPEGPYVVLPLLGPRTLRDAVGEVPDALADPITYAKAGYPLDTVLVVRLVDRRAQLLQATSLVDEAALDRYSFVRDAYLQNRRSRLADGAAPPPAMEDPDAPDPADAGPAPAPAPAPKGSGAGAK